ncbi:MAG TPA: peptidase M61 [Sphingomonadaceae bacterium]|nr:peptidase M61 [Sphingomonadaceae bacterium]
MRLSLSATLPLLALAAPAGANVPRSEPQPIAVPHELPAARDVAYPGTIRLTVDATDTARRIFKVREEIPVVPGKLTLLYPQWLPGHHAPRGPIDALAGIRFTANGTTIPWRRDTDNVYALHLDIPQGATLLTAEFDYLSPTRADQGRVTITPDMLNLQWNLVSLYPAGYFTRRIPVEATAILPAGWRYGVALDPIDPAATGQVRFKAVDFETLVDSPMFAGRNVRQEQLDDDVRLTIVADTPAELAATPEQLAAHRRLVDQAVKLFGTRHYDRYEMLLAISDTLGGIGLEHHRSSENGVPPGYFTKWDESAPRRNILPHEFTHSWNGKYRRPAGLWTPDYSVPMQPTLLWVYEGQTQYWGYVLQARSGIVSREDTLAAYAMIAALYESRPGRRWRPLVDTTLDPIMAARRPEPWTSWQRSEDYYNEGLLVWLDADMRIRELTGGKRSLDDFARRFFGPVDRDWGVSTYTFDDVVAALNAVAPDDWAGFLHARVDEVAPHAPLGWLEKSGYKLVYTAEPTAFWTASERARKITDLSYSLGFTVDKDDVLSQVIWDSPAFAAGLTIGTKLMGLDGKSFDAAALKAAITEAAASRKPVELLIKEGDAFRTVAIPYYDGLRYPRLERTGSGPAALDRLLAPLK